MSGWKRAAAWTAMFAAMAVGAVAGQAPGPSETSGVRESKASSEDMTPERFAQLNRQIAPILLELLASELSIEKAKAKDILEAYLAVQEDGMKKLKEASLADDLAKTYAIEKEIRDNTQKVLNEKMTPPEVEKAGFVLNRLGGLEASIRALAHARVEQSKIDKALPILVKYHRELAGLFRTGKATTPIERITKLRKLREATTKELTPIVGKEAVVVWEKYGGRMSRYTARGSGRGGARPSGAQPPPPRRKGEADKVAP